MPQLQIERIKLATTEDQAIEAYSSLLESRNRFYTRDQKSPRRSWTPDRVSLQNMDHRHIPKAQGEIIGRFGNDGLSRILEATKEIANSCY